ncbi:PREDICTED: early nodulin-20-like [Rhagoletis zephyria]|uniref:early nodulin-20-like n=1 Tax=Rhagoletis zephyria TaxID=28612 RepID=UPI000811A481|nr:PREDICTED: early nodulin-20-like [Rhagoletis zephyria]
MSEELLVECPASTMASTLPIPAPQSPALLLNPSPSPAVAPISIIVPSQSVLPLLSPTLSPTTAPISSIAISPSATQLLSSLPSPHASTSFDVEIPNDTLLDVGSSRPSRGERKKLMNALIANIAKRGTIEEQRQRRDEEQRQEHLETMQAIKGLTSCVAELIQVLKPN